MRKFIFRLLLFLLVPIAGAAFLFIAPYERKFAFNYASSDCDGFNWIFYRIFENPKPVDVAFIGSSRTGCGIDDKSVSKIISGNKNQTLAALNFGYCRYGRNMDYLIVKFLLENKKPRIIVLECTEDDQGGSHLAFPWIAQTGDLFASTLLINEKYVSDILGGLESRIRQMRETILKTHRDSLPNPEKGDFQYIEAPLFGDSLELITESRKSQEKNPGLESNQPSADWSNNPSNWFTVNYLRCIQRLALEHNVKIFFLYMPSFGHGKVKPSALHFYPKIGEVWIPPDSIFNRLDYRRDYVHLNERGGDALAKWLAPRIATELTK